VTEKKPTQLERLKNFNKLGEHNSTGLGAIDYIPAEPAAFLQTHKSKSRSSSKGENSNTDLPN